MANARFARRAAAALLAVCFALCAALALAPAARADEGDLDRITRYDVEVTPEEDGTLSITAVIDWLVLDSDSAGPLEWVTIGLPNEAAESLTILTPDTIAELYRDGTYAHITFDRSYYEGETVHFSFSWVQPYLYTLDGTAVCYDYTPGWFEEACVDSMTLRWNAGNGAGIGLPDSYDCPAIGADAAETDGGLVFAAEDLAHGDRMRVLIRYESWPAALSEENSAAGYEGPVYGEDEWDTDVYYEDPGPSVEDVLLIVVIMVMILILIVRAMNSYDGGFGGDPYPTYVYVNGLYYPKGPDGRPRSGAPGVRTPPRSAYRGSGGGGTFGGGAGRGGGGCACACASSCACACACACAGGGRAGCSAKNLYGAVHLPPARPDGEA